MLHPSWLGSDECPDVQRGASQVPGLCLWEPLCLSTMTSVSSTQREALVGQQSGAVTGALLLCSGSSTAACLCLALLLLSASEECRPPVVWRGHYGSLVSEVPHFQCVSERNALDLALVHVHCFRLVHIILMLNTWLHTERWRSHQITILLLSSCENAFSPLFITHSELDPPALPYLGWT